MDGLSSQWSTISSSTKNSEKLSQKESGLKLAQKYEMWLKMQNEQKQIRSSDAVEESKQKG